jgi:hypothetical protein
VRVPLRSRTQSGTPAAVVRVSFATTVEVVEAFGVVVEVAEAVEVFGVVVEAVEAVAVFGFVVEAVEAVEGGAGAGAGGPAQPS